jgi:molecular chaperone GrpE
MRGNFDGRAAARQNRFGPMMQDNDPRNEPPADTVNSAPATEAPQPAEAPAVAPEVPNPEGAAAGGVEAELKAGRAALEALMKENAELKDRMLRTAAEMENLRKRTEREIADTRTYAIAGFARDMLAATDSVSRALVTVPPDVRQSAEGTLKSLIEGIELTEREMQRLLAKHGVTRIEAQDQKFDPHKHQAMFEVPDATKPEGTVVQVVQEGYAIGERILRPALVGVSKGGPKPGAAPAESAGVDKSA